MSAALTLKSTTLAFFILVDTFVVFDDIVYIGGG